MECIKCGHQEEDGREICSGCGLVFSSLQSGEGPATEAVYDRYLVFRRAVANATEGRWTADEFKRFLDEESFKMAQREQDIRLLQIPSDAVEAFREELEAGFEGIELYNKALLHFRRFASGGDVSFARSGLDLAWIGNEKINEARRLNRKNRDTPAEASA